MLSVNSFQTFIEIIRAPRITLTPTAISDALVWSASGYKFKIFFRN